MMRFPFMRAVAGHVGGGLLFRGIPDRHVLRSPIGWEAPRKLDNSGYCTPLESQGRNPWCAAYSMCHLLQASYWRDHNFRLDFHEGDCYAGAKRHDGITGDGTSLEAVITEAQMEDLSGGKGIMPAIQEQVIVDPEDVVFSVHKYGLILLGLQITAGWQYPRMNGMIGGDEGKLGGHAVLCSGYDLDEDVLWGPNWWGTSWGRKGFWMMTRKQFARQFVYAYGCDISWGPQ